MMEYSIKNNSEKLIVKEEKSSSLDLLGTMLLGIFMWILMGFNTFNADYRAYELLYQKIATFGIDSDQNIEIGYRLLMKLSSNLSLNYQGFLIVTSFFCILAFSLLLRKITNEVFFSMLLFLIFGFFSSAIQIRNFIACIIIIFAIYIFLKLNGLKSYIYYVIIILIASLFHVTSLFYLLFILIKFDKKVIFTGFIISTLVIFTLKNNLQVYFSDTKFTMYLDPQASKGMATNVILLIYFFSNCYLVKRISTIDMKDNKTHLSSMIFYINLLASVSFPLVMINNNFIRLIRNIFLLNYSVYASTVASIYKKTKIKNYIIILAYFSFVLFSAYFFTVRGSAFEASVLSLFRNNLLFNWISKLF